MLAVVVVPFVMVYVRISVCLNETRPEVDIVRCHDCHHRVVDDDVEGGIRSNKYYLNVQHVIEK